MIPMRTNYRILRHAPSWISNPRMGSQHVNTEILLMSRYEMAKGKWIHQKHDVDGDPISRSSQNSILDRSNDKFAHNNIAKLMYDQIIFLEFVDHGKSNLALTIETQKIAVTGQENCRKLMDCWGVHCN